MPLWRLAAGDGYVWAAQEGGPELARISTASGRVERFRPVNSPSTGLAAGDGSLFVASDGQIARVVPGNGSSGNSIPYHGSGRITYGDGALWSLDGPHLLRKLDPNTGRELARARLDGTVNDVAIGGGLVWAAVAPDATLVALDERTLRVRHRFAAGADPERLSFASGRVWIANSAARAVSALDPRTGARKRLAVGAMPTSVAYGDGVVWTGTVPEPPALPPAGGPELRLSLPGAYITLDPAVSHSTADEQLEEATCANLLGYPDVAGPAGKRLRPEAAAAMPRVSADGRTYTFHIRSGFRFSPPSNEAVTAATFKHSLERAFSPKLGRGVRGPSDAPAIVGLPAFFAGKAAHVSGIQAKGNTLSITLTAPAGDFLTRISLPHLCPVPLSVPIRPLPAERVLPSSGPYYISSAADGRIVLLPNPGYGGDRPRRWARIVYTLDVPTPHAVALVDRGELDYLPLDFDSDSLLWRYTVLERALRARQRSAPALLPDDGRLPRLHRAQRQPPALPRRADAARRQLRARPAATHARVPRHPGRRDRPAFRPRLPGRRRSIRSTGPTWPRRAGWQATARAMPCSRTARSSPGRRRRAQGRAAREGRPRADRDRRLDRAHRRVPAGVRRGLEPGRPADGDELRLGREDPLPYLDRALATGRFASALGPGPWNSPSFRRRFEAARSLRGQARTRAYASLERELMRAAPFAVYGTFSGGQYVSPRIGCEVTTAATAILDLVALCPRPA